MFWSILVILFARSDCELFFLGVDKKLEKRRMAKFFQQLP